MDDSELRLIFSIHYINQNFMKESYPADPAFAADRITRAPKAFGFID